MVDYTDSFLGSLMLTMIVSLLVASPFLIASIISKEYRHPLRLRADLASFSAGIFIGAVTFSIIEESIKLGDIFSMGLDLPSELLPLAWYDTKFRTNRY